MTLRTRLALASALVLGLATAGAASAADIHLDDVGLYGGTTAHFSGPVLNGDEDAVGFLFTVNSGIGAHLPTYTLNGFCVDLFHNISPGANDLQYHTEALLYDSNTGAAPPWGAALTAAQISEIYGLANLGDHLARTGAPDLDNKLSAIQGAIWQVEYATETVSFVPGVVQEYFNAYLKMGLKGTGYAIYSGLAETARTTQGFVIGVPEPSTWALMIGGFGMIGAALRRRRAAVA